MGGERSGGGGNFRFSFRRRRSSVRRHRARTHAVKVNALAAAASSFPTGLRILLPPKAGMSVGVADEGTHARRPEKIDNGRKREGAPLFLLGPRAVLLLLLSSWELIGSGEEQICLGTAIGLGAAECWMERKRLMKTVAFSSRARALPFLREDLFFRRGFLV